jgi:hypothetical protein
VVEVDGTVVVVVGFFTGRVVVVVAGVEVVVPGEGFREILTGLVWKLSTEASPTTVPAATMGDLFMATPRR